MIPQRPVVVLCASRSRPGYLHRAVASMCRTSQRVDFAAYVDDDQREMYLDAHDWQADFGDRLKLTFGSRVGPNLSLNALFRKHREEYEIFGVTPDDSQFLKVGWDAWVIEQMDRLPGRIGVISPAHGDGHYVCYPYVSREWYDIVGWYAMPQAHSFVWDTCVELLGEATNIIQADREVFAMGHDALRSENFDFQLAQDEHAFLSWCAAGRQGAAKRLREAMWRNGKPTNVCHKCGTLL